MAAREVRTEIVVRWRDLDMLGHMNQAVYHEILEEGRGGLFRSLGGDAFPFALVHVELDYKHEVRQDHGHVVIVTGVGRVGSSSVTLKERVELPDGTVAASGTAVLVAWDVEARSARPLSDDERAALSG